MGFNFHFTLGPLSAFPSIFSSYHIPLLTFVESFQYITFKKKIQWMLNCLLLLLPLGTF